MSALIDRVLEGRSFVRASHHPSGLSCATRLVPPPNRARGYEDAYALTPDLLVTTKNLRFDRNCEETELGWGRLVLCVHLQGYRAIEVPQVGRFELKTPAFAAFYQAPGVAKRTIWLSGGKETSVLAGFAPQDPPVHTAERRSVTRTLERALQWQDRPFLWHQAPLDAHMEAAARALISPTVHDALLQPYLAVKAQELICLGLSHLLSGGGSSTSGGLSGLRDPRLARACGMIREDERTPVTVASIAEEIGLSVEELNTRFRSAYGINLSEFIVTTRMTRARVLLEQTDYRLKEIAFRTGYRHVSNFCTAYKRHYGVTPSQARRSVRDAGGEIDQ
jgi:AraC-like DNA-binding protein